MLYSYKNHGYYTLRFAGLFNLPIPLRFAFGIGVSTIIDLFIRQFIKEVIILTLGCRF